MEKLLDEMTLKLGIDQKRTLNRLAEMQGVSASELVRSLIDAHIAERLAHFHALTSVFGDEAATRNDKSGGM